MTASGSHARYGSELLAVLLPVDGKWIGMGAERNYSDKFWWWRLNCDAQTEPQPDLRISGLRLDHPAPTIEITDPTNAYGNNWDAMLVGMELPTSGCWELRATYQGAQELTVVVLVGQ